MCEYKTRPYYFDPTISPTTPLFLQHMSLHECDRFIQAGSLAGAGRILTIFSSEQVRFLRFECLQIG